AYGRSDRITWLLLTGTATSPACTLSATLMELIWAAAGAAAPSRVRAAAPSASLFNILRAITPHLVIAALGPPDDLDAVGWRPPDDWRGWRGTPYHQAPGRLIYSRRCRAHGARHGLRISSARPAAVDTIAKVGETDRLGGRAVLLIAGLP